MSAIVLHLERYQSARYFFKLGSVTLYMSLLERIQAARGEIPANSDPGILDIVAGRLSEIRGQRPASKLLSDKGLVASLSERIRNPVIFHETEKPPPKPPKSGQANSLLPGGFSENAQEEGLNAYTGNDIPKGIRFH